MTAPLCFLDTETDGVHPGRKVWEVAAIRRDADGERPLNVFVEIDLSTADPFGLRVGRFHERHPLGRHVAGATDGLLPTPSNDHLGWRSADAPRAPRYVTERAAAYAVARWTHGAHIVGAVPNFDTEVLAGLLRAHGLTPAWHYHLIDVEALAVGWVHGSGPAAPDSPAGTGVALPWKSDDLSRLCGVEPASDEERHTAMGDAEWAMRLYDAITGGPR